MSARGFARALERCLAKEILIVDDDRALARSLIRAIESQGYVCREAHDGNAALTAVSESTPDLVLLDMLLPKKDGYAVMQALKASDATRHIKIIAMSGIYKGRDHGATATKAGALEFMEKPFSASDLASKLTKHLGKAEKVEEAEEKVEKTSLTEHPPAELLWRAMREGFSGAVHFQDSKRHKIVVLDKGKPRLIRSNLAKEALGQRLLRSGRIGKRTFDDAIRRGKATGRRLGEILVDLGAVRRVELDRVLEEQGQEKILELFSWSQGESWRQAGIRSVNLASDIPDWGLKELILRGVQRMKMDWVRRVMEPFWYLKVSRAITEFDGFEEDPAVANALRSVDGERTVGDLGADLAPLLYGLYLVGGVRLADSAAKAADGPASKTRGASPKIAAAPTAQKPAGSTNTNTNLENELRAMLERMRSQDHFEILSVPRDATTAEIRKAFMRKAKIYHPDKVGVDSGTMGEVASELFALISDAHQLLADEHERQDYLEKLEAGTLGQDDGASVKRILSAEALFKKGDELVRARRYGEALEALQEAIDLDPEEGEFHALYGWAAFLVNRQDDAGRATALEHLQKSIALAPKSPSGYYYLGLARKACEQEGEAEKMFRKVLELRPEHVEAARELRLFQMRKGNKK